MSTCGIGIYFSNHFTGKLLERTMMRKYGVENINEHFMSFNTICDATQVVSPPLPLIRFLNLDYLKCDCNTCYARLVTS